ncbi:oligosaccharide flippase family protein [Microbacterium esteraromaticum]|uniref:lipopolysaccharide biosynthesis protein n=1 Tax=Microbacterium esteraromaticum TaxID=57043 RepID=UPI0030A64645
MNADEDLAGRESARRGFGRIAAGTALGQVATFIALPFLSRFYSAEQFGILAVSLAVVAAVAPIVLLGFDHAMLVPKKNGDLGPLITCAAISVVLACCGVAIFVLVAPDAVAPPAALRGAMTWALPTLLLTTCAGMLFTQLAVRAGKYSGIGTRNSVQSIAISVAQLLFAPLSRGNGFNGLVVGATLGSTVGAALLLPRARPYFRRVSPRECFSAMRRYWRFPALFAPLNSLSLASQQAPIFFTALWFGAAESGQVGMAERLVAIPLALVGLATSSVFSGEYAFAVRQNVREKRKIYLRASVRLGIIGLAILAAIAGLAQYAIPFVLGDGWQNAAQIAQVMALVAATRLVCNPLRGVFRLLSKGLLLTLLDTSRVIAIALALAATWWYELDLIGSLTAIYAVMAGSDIVAWFAGFVVSHREDR